MSRKRPLTRFGAIMKSLKCCAPRAIKTAAAPAALKRNAAAAERARHIIIMVTIWQKILYVS